MENKFLFSVDLDATLLNSNQEVSSRAISYIQELVNKGHHFIINTGRPYQGAKRFLKMLGIHEPMIVNNGTAIVYLDNEYETVSKYIKFWFYKVRTKIFVKKI